MQTPTSFLTLPVALKNQRGFPHLFFNFPVNVKFFFNLPFFTNFWRRNQKKMSHPKYYIFARYSPFLFVFPFLHFEYDIFCLKSSQKMGEECEKKFKKSLTVTCRKLNKK